MENLQSYLLRPGDQLVKAIFTTGMTKHFAVYLGRLSDGQEWIAENHYLTGGVKLPFIYIHHIEDLSKVR